jgi:hypothetical protein
METPTKTTPIKPPPEEMHPQLYHQTTAKPRDEARHLGFSQMAPHTEPPKKKGTTAALLATPSRIRDIDTDAKSPSFQFTFQREHSLELSPEAKKLMYEKREEAARIREQMAADGEAPESIDALLAKRKLAKPTGRYSQAHLQQFEKMDSITNHASLFRADPARFKALQAQQKTKSLKRSPSKAELDRTSSDPSDSTPRHGTKKTVPPPTSHSAKRPKRAEAQDVSVARQDSSDSDAPLPSTPHKSPITRPTGPALASLTTPTQSSLARAASTKVVKTSSKIPAPQFSPAKGPTSILKKPAFPDQHQTSTPLLSRSPTKVAFSVGSSVNPAVPAHEPTSMLSSSLARTPAKDGLFKKAKTSEAEDRAPTEKPVPFLTRSPLKASVAKQNDSASFEADIAPTAPLLSRTPTKLPTMTWANEEQTTGKSLSNKLFGRFALLRQSPVKSILRSPQRLYSNDPAKVASGTHLATPPGMNDATQGTSGIAPSTAQKRVDFSSSTKAYDLSEAVESESRTPLPPPESREPAQSYPQLPLEVPMQDRMPSISPSPQKRRQTAGPQNFTFRAGDHDVVFAQSPNAPASTANRNRSATIRHVSSGSSIPKAPLTGSKKRKSDFESATAAASLDEIVSPPVGTKKRKFAFENKLAAAKANSDAGANSDKENTPAQELDSEDDTEQRPTKRAKPSALSPKGAAPKRALPKAVNAPTAASAARRGTLGVKPKGVKSSTAPVKKHASATISQARLAALSQPKKRN